MRQIYMIATRPWEEKKGKYGEWKNLGAYESSRAAAAGVRALALEDSYESLLPVEYEIQIIELLAAGDVPDGA